MSAGQGTQGRRKSITFRPNAQPAVYDVSGPTSQGIQRTPSIPITGEKDTRGIVKLAPYDVRVQSMSNDIYGALSGKARRRTKKRTTRKKRSQKKWTSSGTRRRN
jgi:hypothetical protein